jgi:hypothetical protein
VDGEPVRAASRLTLLSEGEHVGRRLMTQASSTATSQSAMITSTTGRVADPPHTDCTVSPGPAEASFVKALQTDPSSFHGKDPFAKVAKIAKKLGLKECT